LRGEALKNTILGLLGGIILLSCTTYGPYEGDKPVKAYTTFGNQNNKLTSRSTGFYPGKGDEKIQIYFDETKTFQTIRGFGASLTDSSASLIFNHPKREEIMKDLFSLEEGIGINYLRQPIGASDFAREWYTYAEVPGDLELEHFSIATDEEFVIPLLKQAKALNPELQIMGTPWTAPGWMKTGKKYGEKDMVQGFLDPQYYEVYARYLIKTMKAYKAHGVPFDTITLQNEPENFSATWPSMYMSSDVQRKFITILGPMMEAEGLETEIVIYDHNWNQPSYPRDVLDFMKPEDQKFVAGAAFHGYNGSPEGQSIFKSDYPDMSIFFTELSGGAWSPHFPTNIRWTYQNVFIGAIRNWAETVILWNIALDEKGGPSIGRSTTDPNEICRGVVTINSQTGRITREVEYFMLGHMTQFVRPGAKRIETNNDGDIHSVGFVNPDGSKVLVVLNSSWRKGHSFNVNYNNEHFSFSLPTESIATFVWE